MTQAKERDHGGGLDAAIARFGGTRTGWLDLSTGINPLPYPVGAFSADAWTALPDKGAFARLEAAARKFWNVPEGAAVLAAPGASALIARIPSLLPAGQVQIEGPTYNEHAAGFQRARVGGRGPCRPLPAWWCTLTTLMVAFGRIRIWTAR